MCKNASVLSQQGIEFVAALDAPLFFLIGFFFNLRDLVVLRCESAPEFFVGTIHTKMIGQSLELTNIPWVPIG